MDDIDEIIGYVERVSGKKNIVGIIVFGSTVSGGRDSYSDLDLAVITRNGESFYKYLRLNGRYLDILFVPQTFFERIVDEAVERSSSSLWITDTLYLKILFEGEILYDPRGVTGYWRRIIGVWQWFRSDIELALDYLYENLDLASEMVERDRLLEASIALMEAVNLIVTIHVLKSNEIPSPRPRDLYFNAMRHGVIEEFSMIHGLRGERILDEDFMRRLRPRSKSVLVLRHWRKLLRELGRGEKDIALLEARNLAVVEAAIALNKPIPLPYIASRKTMIVSGLPRSQYEFFKKLYNIADKNLNDIKRYMDAVEALTSFLQHQL